MTDPDVIFQRESLDGTRLALVSLITHVDQSVEYQVDYYLGDSLDAQETHYCSHEAQARALAHSLTS
jgi:hypothetical protein